MISDLPAAYALARDLPAGEQRRERLLDVALLALRTSAEEGPLPLLPRLLADTAEELRGAGELRKGGELCQRAAALLGGSLHFTAGKALFHAGQLPEAEAALRAYLREGPSGPPGPDDDPDASPLAARHLLGRVALLDNQLRLAERWLKEALSLATADQRVPISCDLVRVWLRARRLDRAIAALCDLCAEPSDDPEILLLSAEVAMMIGDMQGALPLCRAALDPTGEDDRAAALLATLLLRGARRDESIARRLLPLLPGRRFDTLAVRELLLQLAGEAPQSDGGEATRSAATALLSSLPPAVRQRIPSILTDKGRPGSVL